MADSRPKGDKGKQAKMISDAMMKGNRSMRGDETEYSRKDSDRGKN